MVISSTPFLSQFVDLYKLLTNFKQKQKYFDLLCVIIAKIRTSSFDFPPSFLESVDFLYNVILDTNLKLEVNLEEYIQTLIILLDYSSIRDQFEKPKLIKLIEKILTKNISFLRLALILIVKIYQNGFLDDVVCSPEISTHLESYFYSGDEEDANAIIDYFNLLLQYNKEFFMEYIIPILMDNFQNTKLGMRNKLMMYILKIAEDEEVMNSFLSNP